MNNQKSKPNKIYIIKIIYIKILDIMTKKNPKTAPLKNEIKNKNQQLKIMILCI